MWVSRLKASSLSAFVAIRDGIGPWESTRTCSVALSMSERIVQMCGTDAPPQPGAFSENVWHG